MFALTKKRPHVNKIQNSQIFYSRGKLEKRQRLGTQCITVHTQFLGLKSQILDKGRDTCPKRNKRLFRYFEKRRIVHICLPSKHLNYRFNPTTSR